MKKLLAVVVLACFASACSTAYKPVASLEEILSKEEIEASRNWIEPNSPKKQAAAFASGLMGGLLIGLPLAMALAAIPDEKGLTLLELSDRVAAKTCDGQNKFIRFANGLSDEMGIIGVNVEDGGDISLRPIGVMFISKKDDEKRIYPEVWLVKKIDEGIYWDWRIPLLKKTETGSLTYVLNDKLTLDGGVTITAGEEMFQFTFTDASAGGAKVTKNETELIQAVKAYFMGNSFEMETMKCALGDKTCGTKDEEAPKADSPQPEAQTGS
jgi:hypothetical protein